MLLDPKPNELSMTRLKSLILRAVPVSVAIGLDEFWIGVKGLSNLVIAGFP